MKTLQIDEQKARNRYKSASQEIKEILEDTFGREFFSDNIIDRIKSFEDACSELGIEPMNEKQMIESGFTTDEIDYRKLKIITKAYNEGWIADYNDSSQEKWVPWFNFSPSGVRFDYSGYDISSAYAGLAARLCFENEAKSNAAGKTFTKLYAKFIN